MKRALLVLLAFAGGTLVAVLIRGADQSDTRGPDASALDAPPRIESRATASERIAVHEDITSRAPIAEAIDRNFASDTDPRFGSASAEIFVAPPIADLYLTVVSDDGTPIAGARVESNGQESITDTRGSVTLAGVTTGTKYVVEADGHEAVRRAVRLRGVEPAVPRIVQMTPARAVRVRLVEPGGRPFLPEEFGLRERDRFAFRLEFAVTAAEPGSVLAPSTDPTHSIDRVVVGSECEWRATFRGRGPAFAHVVLGGVVVGSAPIPNASATVDVVLDLGVLAGLVAPITVQVVSDEDGHPVAGAAVSVGGRAATTDARGRVDVTIAAGARLALTVRAAGYARSQIVAVRPYPDPIVVRLETGRRVRGLVLDAHGRPVADVSLMLEDVEDPDRRFEWTKSFAKTDADGEFAFTDVAGKRHALLLRYPGRHGEGWLHDRAGAPVDCTHGDVDGITLRVEPALHR